MVEPFMPSYSAKVYEQMLLLNDMGEKIFGNHDEALLAWIKGYPERIADHIPAGYQIGEPAPIFRETFPEEIDKWRANFDGKDQM